ncbi:hypothetical protein F2Q70_00011844 [Brassica cretica]|uniref:Nicalin n=1 Tax=Brassica cretica TaxID=69181 RepID=A0A8S9M0R1_BRACR|nr:hypothetical protein F2Q70_00011844 [Brassica cretica]
MFKSTLFLFLHILLMVLFLQFPVYFAFENEETDAMLADVKKNDALGQQATATTGGYKLVISVSEPRKIASPTITNIQGWLPGSRAEGDSNQLPTIAIVASYDTFGAAPALSVGSDSNGSGVVALLEVARLFSTLYSNPKTRGRYNLLFALTSGGPYNYEGTQKWLKSLDQRMRESIDYAICLNSVGSWDNELLVHVSKPPDNAYIKQIFEGFSNVAEDLGFQVALKHKKINISNSRVAWEHEQFSRLRVTAATVSELLTPPELLESAGSLSDTRQHVNEDSIIKGVKLVAESLARHIYGHQGKDIQIFADNSSLAVNRFYVKSWLDGLSQTPRVAPFLSKNEPLIMALKKELEDYTAEVSIQQESLDGIFTFYDSTKASLNIYQVASVTFDLLLLLVLGSYLIMLFSFLVITTRVAWEHEQFSRLRVTAATLSELPTPPELLESAGSLSDTRQLVHDDAIIKGVKLVAESLARHIYGHQRKDIKIFADDSSLAVNPFNVRSWLDLLSQTPRVAPFLSKSEPLIMALKKELEDYTAEVSVQHESLDGIFTFYDSTKASLNIYQVASVTFDLLLLLVLGSYLIVLFSFLVITTRGVDDLISLFRRPPSRKVKMV